MPRLQPLITCVLWAFAAFRVTRFLIEDSLIEEPREWIRRKLIGHPTGAPMPVWRRKLLELIECPWCMSVWVSAATVLLGSLLWDAPRPPLLVEWVVVCGMSIAIYMAVEKLAE